MSVRAITRSSFPEDEMNWFTYIPFLKEIENEIRTNNEKYYGGQSLEQIDDIIKVLADNGFLIMSDAGSKLIQNTSHSN